MDLRNLFYRNKRLTALTLGLIVVAGIAAFNGLARQEDPAMIERYALIKTFYPGATASRIESLVSEKIENRLRKIEQIEEVASNSRAGFSTLRVQLDDSLNAQQVEVSWGEVRSELEAVYALLPLGSTKPDLEVLSLSAVTIAVAFKWQLDSAVQLRMLSRLALDLKNQFSNLSSTKDAEIYGESEEELVVAVDKLALQNTGLSSQDIANIIAANDAKNSAGKFRGQHSELVVEVVDTWSNTEQLRNIALSVDSQGLTTRLGDVAVISKQEKLPARTQALISGQDSVVVTATMEPGKRIDLWASNAHDIIDNFRQQLPAGIDVEIIYDQNAYTSDRLVVLSKNLFSAVVIVLLALVFLMGVRSAITVGIALPLTMAMVLIGLNFLDIPLHQMSVTGLIISLGLLIDNAIVVVEEFKQHRGRNLSVANAISNSVGHLFIPLLASTATTVFAFMPIALTPGGTGEFTGSMAISVVLSVCSSFFLAMTIVPAISGYMDKRYQHSLHINRKKPWWVEGYSNPVLLVWYRRSLSSVLNKPIKGVLVALVLPIIGFFVSTTLPLSFFPPVDRNQFQIQITLPVQASASSTRKIVEQARQLLAEFEQVVESHWFIGEGAPKVYYNVMTNNDGISSFASGWVTTQSTDDPREILPEVQRRLQQRFPQAKILALPFEQGPPISAPIEVKIKGDDLAILQQLGDQVRLALSKVDLVTYSQATLSGVEPKLALRPEINAIARAGLNVAELSSQLNADLDGLIAADVMEGTHAIPIRVRYANNGGSAVADIGAIAIQTRNGSVPLDQFAQMSLQATARQIDRDEGQRVNTVSAFLVPYSLPAQAIKQFRENLAAANIQVPSGYSLNFGGEEEERSESVGQLISTFMLFVVLMIAVVVLSLNSFRYAALIGSVGFLSIGLAMFGVWISGHPMGFMAIVGTLGLIGLAINGAIIVLSALKINESALEGDVQAVENVVVESTRHIVSTTVTTIGGFLPLILFGGAFWPPLATAIAGGVAGSAILALYFVPCVFIVIAKGQAREQQPTDFQLVSLASVQKIEVKEIA